MSGADTYESFVRDRLDHSEQADAQDHSAVICLATSGSPVIYVSDAFEAHTGYRADEVIGRPLSILQGPETEPEAVELFRELISTGTPGRIRITNYRKDKTRFLHECVLRPIRDNDGEITHFIAIQKPMDLPA